MTKLVSFVSLHSNDSDSLKHFATALRLHFVGTWCIRIVSDFTAREVEKPSMSTAMFVTYFVYVVGWQLSTMSEIAPLSLT
jgi:hypothetical protein